MGLLGGVTGGGNRKNSPTTTTLGKSAQGGKAGYGAISPTINLIQGETPSTFNSDATDGVMPSPLGQSLGSPTYNYGPNTSDSASQATGGAQGLPSWTIYAVIGAIALIGGLYLWKAK